MALHFMGFGHSQAWCVASASRVWESESGTTFEFPLVGTKAFPGGLVVRDRAGRSIASPLLSAALDRVRAVHGDVVALSFCFGNHYNAIGLLEGRYPIELIHPRAARPLRSEGPSALVPHRMIVDQIRSQLAPLEELFGVLRADGVRVVHVDGPPPTGDEALIAQTVERSRAKFPDARAAPTELRRRLWLCQIDATAEMCAATDVEYLVPPPSVMDADGLLRPEFAKDGVHGNGAYGRHMLSWIEETTMDSSERGAA